ncbi:hypothetical protein [Trinickia fusca]|uniref:Uncharacterized protein n=1 Tax=Trinickia fusca TaxID=2419777 RepID=A0A494XW65_9BURK|nr:hypothetical protein [Trinickia fusca]RKP52344.1 hypothetical protein D7S89_02110 [Trinickia fusca]
MQRELRHALDTAYARLRDADASPTTFAGNYALGLGIVVGGQACGGMTEQEAAEERAHLVMLATLYEARERVRSDFNAY